MSVLAEYAVVLVYTSAGLRLPLKQDEADYERACALSTMDAHDAGAYAPLRGYGEA